MDRATTQDQIVEVRGKVFKQATSSAWRVHFEVLPGEKSLRVRATLKEVQHKIKGGAPAALDHSFADRLQGRQFTVSLTPHGRLLGFEGYTDFMTQAAENQPARMRALRTLLPEEALKEAFADLLGPLPDRAIAPGASWSRTVREPLPHFGALTSIWHLSADGPSSAGYQIAYTIQTSYQAPAADDAPLFRIVRGSLQGENGRGKMLFDAAAGRLLRHERRMAIRGTLTVDMMGMQVPLEFVSTNVVEIKSR